MRRIDWIHTLDIQEVAKLFIRSGEIDSVDWEYDGEDEYMVTVPISGYFTVDNKFFLDEECAIEYMLEYLNEEI